MPLISQVLLAPASGAGGAGGTRGGRGLRALGANYANPAGALCVRRVVKTQLTSLFFLVKDLLGTSLQRRKQWQCFFLLHFFFL